MRDNLKKWFGFGIAIATIVIGALAIVGSFALFDVSSYMPEVRVFVILVAILTLVSAGSLLALGIIDLSLFLKNKDSVRMKYFELLVPAAFDIAICIMTSTYINLTTIWSIMIFDIAVVVILLVALLSKYDRRTKGILTMVACGVYEVSALFSISTDPSSVLSVFYIAAFITYFVFEYFVQEDAVTVESNEQNNNLQ